MVLFMISINKYEIHELIWCINLIYKLLKWKLDINHNLQKIFLIFEFVFASIYFYSKHKYF